MQKSWKNLIDNHHFEQQTFPIAAMFACSRYVGMYLSYTILPSLQILPAMSTFLRVVQLFVSLCVKFQFLNPPSLN